VLIGNTGHEATDAAGHLGKVRELHDWGALLDTLFGSGEYRAAWSEMTPVVKPVAVGMNRGADPHRKNGARPKPVRGSANYSGPPCSRCQGMNFQPAGACWACLDCGESSGCS
jgi:hypothetical protein